MILRAKKWEEFQHYQDRDPPWIKLHKRMLDDRVFHRLPDASRALAPMVWLLCSESSDGSIKDAVAEISFRLRMTEKKAEEALNPLIEAGFFIVEQAASDALADRKPTACLDKRREEEEEKREIAGAFQIFADAADRRGWPKPTALTPKRERSMRARLKEHGIDGWTAAVTRAEASSFIPKMRGWSLSWFIEPENFAKVHEGNYDDRRSTDPPKAAGWN